MKFRVLPLLCLLTTTGLTGCFLSSASTMEGSPGVQLTSKEGTFAAQHNFKVTVPEGSKKFQAWFAMPSENDSSQQISDWEVDSPYEAEVVYDTQGNNFLYIEAMNPRAGTFEVKTSFTVTRREIAADLDPSKTRPHSQQELAELSQYLEGSAESVIDSNTKQMAKDYVGSETNPLVAARLIYDGILGYMEYHVKDPKSNADKTMGSTGTGSSVKAYKTKCGNCTDFHSLYAAVSRSAGIPTRAVYGSFFKGPLDGKDKDQSYHCWIEFHAPNIGWVPLDVAVGDVFVRDFKANHHSRPRANLTVADGYEGPNPILVNYYFGNLEERRVSWHWGRDLVMSPPQAGKPLLWNPKAYIEIDGREHKKWTRKLTYNEIK